MCSSQGQTDATYRILPPRILGLYSGTSRDAIDRPLLDGHMHVCSPVVLEETLNELHTLKNILFLEASSNDLHADRETVHLVDIIADISILLNLVPRPEYTREFIERAVHARDGHNARGVIELQYDQKKETEKIRVA
jgi:hypothetical protein